jgi:hypothetical protein
MELLLAVAAAVAVAEVLVILYLEEKVRLGIPVVLAVAAVAELAIMGVVEVTVALMMIITQPLVVLEVPDQVAQLQQEVLVVVRGSHLFLLPLLMQVVLAEQAVALVALVLQVLQVILKDVIFHALQYTPAVLVALLVII